VKLVISIVLMLAAQISIGQKIDKSKPNAYFLSHLNHHAGQDDFKQVPHNVFIDFEENLIWIENDDNCDIVYKIEFDSAYQGGSPAVVLQEGETMFFTKDWQVQFVMYQESVGVISLIMNEGISHLFAELETEEEIPLLKYHNQRQWVYMIGVKKKKDE